MENTITLLSSVIAAIAAVLGAYYGWKLHKESVPDLLLRGKAERVAKSSEDFQLRLSVVNTGGSAVRIDPNLSRIDIQSKEADASVDYRKLDFRNGSSGTNLLEKNGGKLELVLKVPARHFEIGRFFVVDENTGKEWNIKDPERVKLDKSVEDLVLDRLT